MRSQPRVSVASSLPLVCLDPRLTSCSSSTRVKMALKTKQDVNNEQWQPLQDDWLYVTGRVCVCGREEGCVCLCKCVCVQNERTSLSVLRLHDQGRLFFFLKEIATTTMIITTIIKSLLQLIKKKKERLKYKANNRWRYVNIAVIKRNL